MATLGGRRSLAGFPLLVSCLVVLTGCTFQYPFQLIDATGPIGGDETVYGHAEGRSCSEFVLGIPIKTDRSLALAMEEALLSTGLFADGLMDVTVDTELFTVLGFYTSICTVIRGRPYVSATIDEGRSESAAATRPRPVGEERLGRGVEREDRFKKRRWLTWKDAFVITGKGGRDGLFVSASVMVEDGGASLPAADALFELRLRRWPVPAKLGACEELVFLADGETVEPASVRFENGELIGRFDFREFVSLANASAPVEGRACADEFSLDAEQQKRLRAFAAAVGNRLGERLPDPGTVDPPPAPDETEAGAAAQ